MIKKILNIFRRKKEPTPLPREFALIRLTKSARFKGIDDEENKVIDHYKNGEVVRTYPYSKSQIKALREVDEIPVVDVDEGDEDDFFWEEPTNFGITSELR